MQYSWMPYRWSPVLREGEQFRITFKVERMDLLHGVAAEFKAGQSQMRVEFALGEDSAEMVLSPDQVAAIPHRAPAQIVVDTGAGWETLAEGFVTRVR